MTLNPTERRRADYATRRCDLEHCEREFSEWIFGRYTSAELYETRNTEVEHVRDSHANQDPRSRKFVLIHWSRLRRRCGSERCVYEPNRQPILAICARAGDSDAYDARNADVEWRDAGAERWNCRESSGQSDSDASAVSAEHRCNTEHDAYGADHAQHPGSDGRSDDGQRVRPAHAMGG
jgi:hypothetical protein